MFGTLVVPEQPVRNPIVVPVEFPTTTYVMLKSCPVIGEAVGPPRSTAARCAVPGPSLAAQPDPRPSTQFVSTNGEAPSTLPIVLMLVPRKTWSSVLTVTSSPLRASDP